MAIRVVLRGGGDLATGAAVRMFRSGMQVIVCELPKPYAVRRTVSLAEAVFSKIIKVEEVSSCLVKSVKEAIMQFSLGIPVIISTKLSDLQECEPDVVVDGRMLKNAVDYNLQEKPKIIGLGPGFICGSNCHSAVETRRGPNLGRVIWTGETEKDTGEPEMVRGIGNDRVIRANQKGVFYSMARIGDLVNKGDVIGKIEDQLLYSPIDGVIRGLLHDGLRVFPGLKIGDIDPRMDKSLVNKISDKALAVGGGVVEAILSWPEIRRKLTE